MKQIILTLLLALPALLGAQNQQQAIQRISAAAAQMKTMQGDFTQTKHMKMLGDKMVSKGKMYYRQSDKLRWEYTTPYSYTFVMNGNKVMLKKQNRKDVIDVQQNKMFREIAQIILGSVVGNCLTDSRQFKVSMTESKTAYTATLIPQRKNLKQMYTRIVLVFNRQTLTVDRVTMYEKNGDYTDIDMYNIKKNATVAANIFAIE